jgi:hypothetical protein
MSAARRKPNPAQSSFLPPPPFEPTWPQPGTLAARCLDAFIQGYSLTHPQFEAMTFSWRLAAVVGALRDLGWPIESHDISAPTPENADRIIARYKLPTDVRAAALLMRPRHG